MHAYTKTIQILESLASGGLLEGRSNFRTGGSYWVPNLTAWPEKKQMNTLSWCLWSPTVFRYLLKSPLKPWNFYHLLPHNIFQFLQLPAGRLLVVCGLWFAHVCLRWCFNIKYFFTQKVKSRSWTFQGQYTVLETSRKTALGAIPRSEVWCWTSMMGRGTNIMNDSVNWFAWLTACTHH